jgi:hypothetical protein
MKAPDLYGLALRLTASFAVIWGAMYTLLGIENVPATFLTAMTGRSYGYNSLDYFITSVPALIFGLIALRFADALVRFTYREKTPPVLPVTAEPERESGRMVTRINAMDVFGIIFRVGTLYVCFWGVWYTLAAIRRMILPSTIFTTATTQHSMAGYLYYGISESLIGFLLFRYSTRLVSITYRPHAVPPLTNMPALSATAPENVAKERV